MFNIQFSGLSLGHHKFQFHVDDALFQARNYDEISDCDVNVEIDLEKTERFLKLDFTFSGTYFVPCDRCLDPVEIPVDYDESLIVNFGNETCLDDEIWEVSPKEHELILDDFICDSLVLSRPFSITHDIADCNPEMLAKLQNREPEKTEIDPRWDALRAVKG